MHMIIMKGENYRCNGFRTVVLAIQNWDWIGFGDDAGMILVRLHLDDTRSRVMRIIEERYTDQSQQVFLHVTFLLPSFSLRLWRTFTISWQSQSVADNPLSRKP
jgi:hypothetical protein